MTPERAAPARLSIVAPVYNEARILPELVRRCLRAGEACGQSFELVLADDASTDDTVAVLAGLAADSRVRPQRLAANAGQFGATQAGLRAAQGEWVVVLDGDLQDPPELIPRLVATLETAEPPLVAVFAVKSDRDDPRAFMLGQAAFHWLQRHCGAVALPPGAGSYCLMRAAVAHRVAAAPLRHANLSAVVALVAHALGGQLGTVSYEKQARYDQQTRVGWRGLIAEALESLQLTGALSTLLRWLAIACVLLAVLLARDPSLRVLLLAAALAAAIAAWWASRLPRRLLASLAP